MGVALAVALASVLAGVLAAWLGRSRPALLGPVRTFALVTSVAVGVAQLLPDALAALGLAALGAFVAGSILPVVFEKLATTRRDIVGLEIGFAGLLLHKIGDGLALGLYTAPAHEGHSHIDVLIGIGGHTVPIVALVVLLYADRRNLRSGIVRAALLGGAAVVGVLLAGAAPPAIVERWEPWITAAVAGMLLHVVFHDWRTVRERPSAGVRRAGDLVALALGVVLLLMGGHAHHDDGVSVRGVAGAAFVDLVLQTAPALLFGLAAGAAAQALGSRIAQSLRARGAGTIVAAALALAAPQLALETVALTVRFLGWPFALLRVACAAVGALLAALVLTRLARGRAPSSGAITALARGDEDAAAREWPWPARWLAHFEALLQHVAPWTLAALVAAAFVHAVLSADALVPARAWGVDVVAVSAIAVLGYVCAAAATPLGAVLIAKGLSPGAVLAGLVLGPATNAATVGFLRGACGTRAALASLGVMVAAVWLVALGVNATGLPIAALEIAAAPQSHGWVVWTATAVLAAFVLRGVWRDGLRGWLGGSAA